MTAPPRLNMDFSVPVNIPPSEQEWVTSPADGVSRVHLERVAPESGHTTSLVTFAPGSYFPEHDHPLGEEIFVLKGTFSDEFGDYPMGSYLRNPPGSKHSPFSRDGCKLFVKLDQFHPDDSAHVVVRPEDHQWQNGIGNLVVLSLHEFQTQHTALVYWPANEKFQPHQHWGGEEILVISGAFIDEHGRYPAGTWLRSPHLSKHFPYVEEETLILVKTGHLPED
jgi:anti-sigma factor ChrR (cupin superfamily)